MQWLQLEAESARAYAAFSVYRDFGAKRSLNAAYQADTRSISGAPGTWTKWSADFQWVTRAEAYDQHLELIRLAAREERFLQLEARRIDFEFENQERLERRMRRIEAILDKADVHPLTDVTQERTTADGVTSTTKVKGFSFSGYARLSQEASAIATLAILGVRQQAKTAGPATEKKPNEPGVVKSEFQWIKPEISDAL